MQLRSALQQGLKTLLAHHVPSAELAAELLLMHALGCDRGYLHAHPEAEIPPEPLARYVRMIEERSTGRPTQYITGHQEFWGLDFEVTQDVLIPRPETEHVVETVLGLVPARVQGTASGAAATRPKAYSLEAAVPAARPALNTSQGSASEPDLRII